MTIIVCKGIVGFEPKFANVDVWFKKKKILEYLSMF
jgi:hypothetical protein